MEMVVVDDYSTDGTHELLTTRLGELSTTQESSVREQL
jgi:hypothetical protein